MGFSFMNTFPFFSPTTKSEPKHGKHNRGSQDEETAPVSLSTTPVHAAPQPQNQTTKSPIPISTPTTTSISVTPAAIAETTKPETKTPRPVLRVVPSGIYTNGVEEKTPTSTPNQKLIFDDQYFRETPSAQLNDSENNFLEASNSDR
eukprot:Pgem_evm1s8259